MSSIDSKYTESMDYGLRELVIINKTCTTKVSEVDGLI